MTIVSRDESAFLAHTDSRRAAALHVIHTSWMCEISGDCASESRSFQQVLIEGERGFGAILQPGGRVAPVSLADFTLRLSFELRIDREEWLE